MRLNDEIVTNGMAEEVSSDNAYLVENSDGTYTLYIDNTPSVCIDANYAEMMKQDGFKVIN